MNDDIQRSLGRVEGKLDSLRQDILRHFEDDKENFGSLQTRLRDVENNVHTGRTVTAFIASFVTMMASSVVGYFVK